MLAARMGRDRKRSSAGLGERQRRRDARAVRAKFAQHAELRDAAPGHRRRAARRAHRERRLLGRRRRRQRAELLGRILMGVREALKSRPRVRYQSRSSSVTRAHGTGWRSVALDRVVDVLGSVRRKYDLDERATRGGGAARPASPSRQSRRWMLLHSRSPRSASPGSSPLHDIPWWMPASTAAIARYGLASAPAHSVLQVTRLRRAGGHPHGHAAVVHAPGARDRRVALSPGTGDTSSRSGANTPMLSASVASRPPIAWRINGVPSRIVRREQTLRPASSSRLAWRWRPAARAPAERLGHEGRQQAVPGRDPAHQPLPLAPLRRRRASRRLDGAARPRAGPDAYSGNHRSPPATPWRGRRQTARRGREPNSAELGDAEDVDLIDAPPGPAAFVAGWSSPVGPARRVDHVELELGRHHRHVARRLQPRDHAGAARGADRRRAACRRAPTGSSSTWAVGALIHDARRRLHPHGERDLVGVARSSQTSPVSLDVLSR